MRLFIRDGKWNWVDDNNVFVGYDNMQNCCEEFGYKYALDMFGMEPVESPNIDSYEWDPFFCYQDGKGGCDVEATACFRMTNGESTLYLILYNSHNGYYSHGFKFGSDGLLNQEGYL